MNVLCVVFFLVFVVFSNFFCCLYQVQVVESSVCPGAGGHNGDSHTHTLVMDGATSQSTRKV